MEQDFECPICHGVLDWNREEDIWNHLFYIHDMYKYHQYLCYVCGRKYINHGSQLTHMKNHEIMNPSKCVYCGKEYESAGELEAHTKRHFDQSLFVDCRVCGRHISRKSISKHVQTHVTNFQEQQNKCSMRNRDNVNSNNVHRPKLNENLNTVKEINSTSTDTIQLCNKKNDLLSSTVGQVEKIDDPEISIIYDSRTAQKNIQHDGNFLEEENGNGTFGTNSSSSSCDTENQKTKPLTSNTFLRSTIINSFSTSNTGNAAIVYEFWLTTNNWTRVKISDKYQLEWILDISQNIM